MSPISTLWLFGGILMIGFIGAGITYYQHWRRSLAPGAHSAQHSTEELEALRIQEARHLRRHTPVNPPEKDIVG
jgi:hypothetical protein